MGRLLISAAHTLENPGAIYQDLREADLTRKLLKLCIPHLEKTGIEFQAVPLDLPLLQRIEWINNTGYTEDQGDIMVEIHINDGGKRGVESWYRGGSAADNKSQKLSERLAEYIAEKQKYTNIGAKSEYEHELTSLLILNSINPTGTALEVLFIDNPEDIAILKDDAKMDELAKVIVDGIKDYLDDPNKGSKSSQDDVKDEDNNDSESNPQMPVTPNKVLSPDNLPSGINTPSMGQSQGNFPQRPSFGGMGGGQGLGGIGGNSPFGGFGGGAQPGFGGMGGNKNTLMDREERKKMITELYEKLTGKPPKPADENFLLNTGANKEEVINKITESEEFKKMVEDAKKSKDNELKLQQLESEVATLKANNEDLKSLQGVTQKLLDEKNIMIQRLYEELVKHGIIQTGEHYESRRQNNQNQQNTLQSNKPDTLGKKLAKLVMKITKV